MARVNVGVDPIYLADQHLVAESVEITMITGQLKKQSYRIVSEIPKQFPMGKGHMTFFKNKLLYLKNRLDTVNQEMVRRGFKPGTELQSVIAVAPKRLLNDWQITYRDSLPIRERIAERLATRVNGKPGQGYYRYNGTTIPDIDQFAKKLLNSKLFHI